jgi:rod shape-determining protein MreC
VAVLDLRQRSGFLFLAVMVGHILLISAQINSRSGVPVLETVTFGVFSEIQRGAFGALSSVQHAWTGYIGLRHVRAENEELKRRLAAAEVAAQEQRALAERAKSLERLLALRDRTNLETVAAEIIAAGATPDFRTMTIDKGTSDGIRADMAVVSSGGVVGRIVVPSAHAAKVQLLVDRNAAAGALIERSRAQGVIIGRGDNRLQMEYVSEVAEVATGDMIVTSGIDGIYPKGFVIGQVETIDRSGGGYKRIVVRPTVDFAGLEEVLVVLTPLPREPAEGAKE